MDTIDWIVIVIAAFVYELYKWNGGAMYAKTFRFVLAYFLLPPCFLHAGQKVQPELHLQPTDTRMVKNEPCSVEAFFQQLPDDSQRIFFQARLTRQVADGSEESGRILYLGEILKQGDIEKQRSKATDSCYEHFKKRRR